MRKYNIKRSVLLIQYIIKKIPMVMILVFIMYFTNGCSLMKVFNKNYVKPPKISKHLILHPTFDTEMGTFSAGTAFPIFLEKQKTTIVLTAFHLFGKGGGLPKQISSEELPAFIKRTVFMDAFEGTNLAESIEPIPIRGAEASGKYGDKDLAAFKIVSDKNLPTMKLCKTNPVVGEHVWLGAKLIDGVEQRSNLHEALVTLSNDRELCFKFVNSEINLKAASGSPVLNAKGEIIGLYVGKIKDKNSITGCANPASSIRKLLNIALNK